MITRRSGLLAFASAIAFPGAATAVIRRHDRSDDQYRVDAAEFPTVAYIGGATGTLIAPNWILTAAHTVEGLGDEPFSSWVADINGDSIPYDKIIIRPSRVRDDVNSDFDLSLLHLTRPATVAPSPLYEWSDEAGKQILIVGRGATGVGGSDAEFVRDRQLRRAFNTIDGVFEHSFIFVFNAPPRGLDLEGGTGPGDSGGPAFIERDGHRYLAGVASFNSADTRDRYESVQGYARVSAHRTWITQTIADNPASTIPRWNNLVRTRRASALPSTPAGAALRAMIAGLNASTPAPMIDYITRFGSPSRSAPEARATGIRDALSARPYQLLGYATREQGEIAALLRPVGQDTGLALLMRMSAQARGRVGELATSEVPLP